MNLNRRTAVVAGTAAAVGLMATGASAQEPKEGDKEMMAPGIQGGAKRTATTKKWYQATFASAAAMVTYINTAPAQGAGEVVVLGMTGGSINALVYL